MIDPFFGAGTTGVVCEDLGRDWIGIDIQPDYAPMAHDRISTAKLASNARDAVNGTPQPQNDARGCP